MGTLALESVFDGISRNAASPDKVIYWQTLASVMRSFLPGFWLLFSLTYSRGNRREFPTRWRYFLAAAFLLPIALAVGFGTKTIRLFADETGVDPLSTSFSGTAKTLSVLLLIAIVLILFNLEKAFRSVVGTIR